MVIRNDEDFRAVWAQFVKDCHPTHETRKCTVEDWWDKNAPGQVYISKGASKLCVVPKNTTFVVKWTTGYDAEDFDEAMKEVFYYAEAVKAGVGMFFPKTELWEKGTEINFVYQEKLISPVMKHPSPSAEDTPIAPGVFLLPVLITSKTIWIKPLDWPEVIPVTLITFGSLWR